MAVASKTSTKKTVGAGTKTKSAINEGESVVCGVCGLAVVVESVGGITVSEETALLCCGKPMKKRKASQKAKAAKPVKVAQTLSGWPLDQAAGSSGLVADPKEDVNQQ